MLTDRSKVPFNDSGIIINFPKIQVSNLNKIKIYKYQDNSQPLVNFKINFKNGAVSENVPGTANFTMTMMQSGTQSRSTAQISEEFESLGANYFFNGYWDECAAGFSCLEQYFDKCFDILLDCLYNPTFTDLEIDRQRQKISAMIMQNNSDPSYIAQVAFNVGVFKGHPYSHPRTGSLEDVMNISKQDILDFYDKLISKSDISIVITGNFNDQAINKLIESNFDKISNNQSIDIIPFHIPQNSCNLIAGKDDALQSNLRLGKASIDRKNPDYPAFQVVNTIFGGYFLSRLNHILREVKGLTYGIHSYLDTRKYGSAFIISTSINIDKTAESIKDIFDISNEISSNKLDETEISRSVEFMTGSFARTLETPKQITGLIQTIDSYDLEPTFMSDFYNSIKLLSIDELFEVQKKYFTSDNYFIAASGDSEFLIKELSQFGEIETIQV
jgi:zinc protease